MKKSQEIAIKKNNEIILPKIIKSEVNLLLLPFFALERKDKRLKTEYKEIVKRRDQKTEASWSVSANPEYGYPGPFDREVHKAIEQIIGEILREKRKIENPIPFSIYNLCNRMGITNAGDNYQRIRKALEKIQMTGIKSEGAFYHKGKKKWISAVFGLYDGVIFKGEQIEGDIIAEINLLYLSDIYLQSLNSRHTKSIDYTYWRSLKSKIGSRLYEILGVKFYGIRNKKEEFIRYKYSTLCQLLPLTPYRFISDAKRQLNSGNDELKKTGFISKYDWSETSRKDWLIYYWPGERAKEEIKRAERAVNNRTGEYLPGPKRGLEDFSQEQKDLIDKLLKLNVSRITAEGLIINYDQQLIEKWIEAIHYARAEDKAAYLVKAIRENWQVPEGYLSKEEDVRGREEQEKIRITREKQQEEENIKRREEIKKIEQIYNSLDSSQQEEIRKETKNRMPDFWKEKLNKKVRGKGEISMLLEVVLKENRREIIKEWIDSGRIKT